MFPSIKRVWVTRIFFRTPAPLGPAAPLRGPLGGADEERVGHQRGYRWFRAGREHERTSRRIREIIMRAMRMVDAVIATPRRLTLEPAELSREARDIEQLDLAG